MSPDLPTPGGDDNTWGPILNSFLNVSLNSDGTINLAALLAALGPSGVTPGTYGSSSASPVITVNSEGFVTAASTVTLSAMQAGTYDPAGIAQQVVGTTASQTLTNKTLTTPSIAQIVNGGTLILPTSSDTLVARATTDTLSNKTLSSPHIASIVNSGTLSLPTSTDTLVGRATTDTLTNKRIIPRSVSPSAPASPLSINTDANLDVAVTGLTGFATSAITITTTGSPQEGEILHLAITDTGTAQLLLFDTGVFEFAIQAPYSTTANTRMDLVFNYVVATGKWRLVGVAPGSGIIYQDLGPSNTGAVALTPTPAVVFNPTVPVGTWRCAVTATVGSDSTANDDMIIWVPPTTGGGATYTLANAGSLSAGNGIGARWTNASGGAGGSAITFSTPILVTSTGTINIMGATGSGSGSVRAVDTPTNAQISFVTFTRYG